MCRSKLLKKNPINDKRQLAIGSSPGGKHLALGVGTSARSERDQYWTFILLLALALGLTSACAAPMSDESLEEIFVEASEKAGAAAQECTISASWTYVGAGNKKTDWNLVYRVYAGDNGRRIFEKSYQRLVVMIAADNARSGKSQNWFNEILDRTSRGDIVEYSYKQPQQFSQTLRVFGVRFNTRTKSYSVTHRSTVGDVQLRATSATNAALPPSKNCENLSILNAAAVQATSVARGIPVHRNM